MQVFDGADFLDILNISQPMPDLRYRIDISGLPSYPDLNISQTFDPQIYGYIVKIYQFELKPLHPVCNACFLFLA